MEYQILNQFLDISEFTLTAMQQEYDSQEEDKTKAQRYETQDDHADQLSSIDILTPYLYRQTFQSDIIQQWQLDQNQEFDDEEEQEELIEEQESEEEEDSINIWNENIDLLDAIEQHYEEKHKLQQQAVSQVWTTDSKSVTLEDPESKKCVESTEEGSSTVEDVTAVKYYNYLSYKQNNIEFYSEGTSKYWSETRKTKVERFLKKRLSRNWGKKISYFCRKQVADSRLRVKGRFVTRNQANKLLGMDTTPLTLQQIKSLLQSKFQKEDLPESLM